MTRWYHPRYCMGTLFTCEAAWAADKTWVVTQDFWMFQTVGNLWLIGWRLVGSVDAWMHNARICTATGKRFLCMWIQL